MFLDSRKTLSFHHPTVECIHLLRVQISIIYKCLSKTYNKETDVSGPFTHDCASFFREFLSFWLAVWCIWFVATETLVLGKHQCLQNDEEDEWREVTKRKAADCTREYVHTNGWSQISILSKRLLSVVQNEMNMDKEKWLKEWRFG